MRPRARLAVAGVLALLTLLNVVSTALAHAELVGSTPPTGGVDGTAMPPFKDTLTEEERWHVINCIRTFASPTTVE